MRIRSRKTGTPSLEAEAAKLRRAINALREFEEKYVDLLTAHQEMKEDVDVAKEGLHQAADRTLKNGESVSVGGFTVFERARRGNRVVNAKAVLNAYPNVWASGDFFTMSMKAFDRLVASGAIPKEDKNLYIDRAEDKREIHIKEEDQ